MSNMRSMCAHVVGEGDLIGMIWADLIFVLGLGDDHR